MGRRDEVWTNRSGDTYIETTKSSGYDILINGSNHYLNFNAVSGFLGYGFRDNGGTMEFKNSGGAWAAITGGGGGGSTLAAVSAGSLNATDSTYTMTSAVPVLFKTSGGGTLLKLNEADQVISGVNSSLLFTGTFGSGASIPALGAGLRFQWNPIKGSIRAGSVSGTQWDPTNVGNYSAVFGLNNTGSGVATFAAGFGNTVTATYSSAFGSFNQVDSSFSFAAGTQNTIASTASGSVVFGESNGINAGDSFAAGIANTVSTNGQYSAVFGQFNYADSNGVVISGFGNYVSGNNGGAFGEGHIVLGADSFAFGNTIEVDGQGAFGAGNQNVAGGDFSFVVGQFNASNGVGSFASGISNAAYSYCEASLGTFPTTYSPSSTTAFVGTDRLFCLGNGTSNLARSNAMVVLKNGTTTLPQGLLILGTNTTTLGTIKLFGSTSGDVTIKPAAVAGTSTVFQLPATNGTNGWFLKTNGSGVTSWAAVAASPAGSNTQIQYNNSGAFGANANFIYDASVDSFSAGDSSKVYFSLDGTSNLAFFGGTFANIGVLNDGSTGFVGLNANNTGLLADLASGTTVIGDTGGSINGTILTVDDTAKTYTLNKLATGLTNPTTSGATKPVIVDANGLVARGGNLPLAGSKTATGTATTTFTVTIGTTQANTTYKVNVTPTSTLAAAVFYVNNKTTTTFDVVYLAGLTGTVSFDRSLFP